VSKPCTITNRTLLAAVVTAILVALASILTAATASASPLIHPQTRVAAIEHSPSQFVGPNETILPGGSRERAPNYDQDATGSSVAAEGGADAAFHYTTSETVDSIMESGLRPGSYATTEGDLSPDEAQVRLALNPAAGERGALIQIDLNGLRAAGYDIPEVTQVAPAYGMPGGGWEMQFPYEIPPQYLQVIRP
jgi:hypothetical protein